MIVKKGEHVFPVLANVYAELKDARHQAQTRWQISCETNVWCGGRWTSRRHRSMCQFWLGLFPSERGGMV